jgi:hypothetical protein
MGEDSVGQWTLYLVVAEREEANDVFGCGRRFSGIELFYGENSIG